MNAVWNEKILLEHLLNHKNEIKNLCIDENKKQLLDYSVDETYKYVIQDSFESYNNPEDFIPSLLEPLKNTPQFQEQTVVVITLLQDLVIAKKKCNITQILN
ncbi:MAG: hypothetical protein ABI462_04025 [Ignavibacteria bacterium]